MENTLLYTFSTIPQIIAAMLALTGLFVMLRIDILHKRIMGFGQRILDEDQSLLDSKIEDEMYDAVFRGDEGRKRRSRFLGSIRTDAEKYLIEQIKEVAEIESKMVVDEIIKEIPEKGFNTQLFRVTQISKQKMELISNLKLLILISIFSILFPLLCLVLTPLICCCWSVSLLVINFILTVITVVYTGFLIWKSIIDLDYEGN